MNDTAGTATEWQQLAWAIYAHHAAADQPDPNTDPETWEWRAAAEDTYGTAARTAIVTLDSIARIRHETAQADYQKHRPDRADQPKPQPPASQRVSDALADIMVYEITDRVARTALFHLLGNLSVNPYTTDRVATAVENAVEAGIQLTEREANG